MEKQHLKRLGYGFSALVMTLSAVTFYPSFNSSSAYAEGATSYECGSTDAVADGATVKVAWNATECVMKFAFATSWKSADLDDEVKQDLAFSGVSLEAPDGLTSDGNDYKWELSQDGKEVTVTIKSPGLEKMRSARDTNNVIALTASIEHGEKSETQSVNFDLLKYETSLSYKIGNGEAKKINTTNETVLINSDVTELSIAADFKTEADELNGITLTPIFSDVMNLEADDELMGTTADYSIVLSGHVMTVTLHESGVKKILNAVNAATLTFDHSVDDNMSVTIKAEVPVSDVTLAVADGSSTDLIIDDENSVATVNTTVTPENTTDEYEIEYTYDEEKLVVVTGDNGTATVKAKTGIVLEDDTDVTVIAKVKVGGEAVKTSEPVTFKIAKNAVHTEPEEDGGEDNNGSEDNTGENTGDNTDEDENKGDENTGNNDGEDKPSEPETPSDKPEDQPSDEPEDKPSDKPEDKPSDEPADEKEFGYKVEGDEFNAVTGDLASIKEAYEAMKSAKTSAEKIAASEKYDALVEAFKSQFSIGDMGDDIVEAAMNGATISTEIFVSKWEMPEEDAPYYDEYMEYLEDLKAQFGFGNYLGDVDFYGVSVYVYADDEWMGYMSEPNHAQTIVLSVGSPENGFNRDFKVVREHWNGSEVEYEEIEDWTYDSETGELTFKSDKFSTFAVGHLDVAASPDTGKATAETASASANATLAIVSAIAAITLAGAAVFAKRK